MRAQHLGGLVKAALIAVAAGCEPLGPVAPEVFEMHAAKGGGGTLVADLVQGDFDPGASAAPTLTATACTTGVGGYHVSGCLVVTPLWNEDSGYAPYSLTDDVQILIAQTKPKNGLINGWKLIGQDVAGDAGIGHNTDLFVIDPPVQPDKAGFVVHVHATDVPIWRTDAHQGGNRVAIIGWINIGDIVYRKQ